MYIYFTSMYVFTRTLAENKNLVEQHIRVYSFFFFPFSITKVHRPDHR
jgi:hypothetical protein